MTSRGWAVIACGTLATSPVAAQRPRALAFEGMGASVRLRSTSPLGREALSGSALGGEVRLWRRAVILSVGYLQATLKPDSGSPAERNLVEGWALIGVRPKGWLEVRGGGQVRAYVTPAGTARRMYWEARARGEVPLVGRTAVAYVELWRSLAGSASGGDAVQGAQGGDSGLLVQIPGTPWRVRLAYRIDRTQLRTARRVETLEGVSLAVGIGGR
jgi:hypothetical protein